MLLLEVKRNTFRTVGRHADASPPRLCKVRPPVSSDEDRGDQRTSPTVAPADDAGGPSVLGELPLFKMLFLTGESATLALSALWRLDLAASENKVTVLFLFLWGGRTRGSW